MAAESAEKPWRFTDALWEQYLPDQAPQTGAQWRRAGYAVHAAGCLAGGVLLDVGSTESYWRGSFWVDVLPVIELLANVALATLPLERDELAGRLRELLALKPPSVPLA